MSLYEIDNGQKEYFIYLKNLDTGKVLGILSLKDSDQVEVMTLTKCIETMIKLNINLKKFSTVDNDFYTIGNVHKFKSILGEQDD